MITSYVYIWRRCFSSEDLARVTSHGHFLGIGVRRSRPAKFAALVACQCSSQLFEKLCKSCHLAILRSYRMAAAGAAFHSRWMRHPDVIHCSQAFPNVWAKPRLRLPHVVSAIDTCKPSPWESAEVDLETCPSEVTEGWLCRAEHVTMFQPQTRCCDTTSFPVFVAVAISSNDGSERTGRLSDFFRPVRRVSTAKKNSIVIEMKASRCTRRKRSW
jgi:hypothetical protein